MPSWTWNGSGSNAVGDWFSFSNWSTDSTAPYPQPGDTVTVATTGGPTISPTDPGSGSLDQLTVLIGSTQGASTLTSAGTNFGPDFELDDATGTRSSLLLSSGPVQFDGTANVSGQGSAFVIGLAAGTSAGSFTLNGRVNMADSAALILSLGQDGSFANNGTVEIGAGADLDVSSGALSGNGTVDLGPATSAYFGGTVVAGQTIALSGNNDVVTINDVAGFAGSITGFAFGDVIAVNSLLNGSGLYDAVSYDGHVLRLLRDGAVQASIALTTAGPPPDFHLIGGTSGTLITTSDNSLLWQGGTGDWFDATNWTTALEGSAVPQSGDTVKIRGGTAVISAAEASSNQIEAERITLASDNATPAVMQTDNVIFGPDTMVRSGAEKTDGTLLATGDTLFKGRLEATARAGTLTLDIESDGTSDRFRNQGALIAGQKGALQITGSGELNNAGLILVSGSLDIGANVLVVGEGNGVIQIQSGGSLIVEGSINHYIQFGDATGRLTLDDLTGFQRGQDGIGNFQKGNSIDLPNVVADGFTYAAGALTLTEGTTAVGSLAIQTADGDSDFAVGSDGKGGTLITYPQPVPVLEPGFPVPVVASPGQIVSLRSILLSAFGSVPAAYSNYGLSYMTAASLQANGFSFWDPSTPSASTWTQNDTALPPLPLYPFYPPYTPTTELDASALDSIGFQAGNSIFPNAYLQVPVAGDGTLPTQTIIYELTTIDPHVESPTADNGRVDPSDIVASAQRFASYYQNVLNDDDCPNIAAAVAAAAGATMPYLAYSTDPNANQEGGFWRIAYRGIDQKDPVSNWSTLVQPGDIVRMGWINGGYHTTTVLAKNQNGSIEVYDNADVPADSDASIIGVHDAEYWLDTLPESITIYRLDPLHQFLVNGTPQAEAIQGSVYNNLIQPNGGADTITAGSGNNEIQDTAVHLDGITVTDFHLGDTFDITNLASAAAAASYDGATNTLTVSRDGVPAAKIKLMSQAADQSFLTADDGQGGTIVFSVPVSDGAYSTAVQATLAATLQPLAEAGRTTNIEIVAATAAPPAAVTGQYNVVAFQLSEGESAVLPDGYKAGLLQGNADGTLLDQAQGNAVLVAGSGDDVLQSSMAGDTLIGGSGSDLLIGGPDGSILVGGSGDTLLIGGSGSVPLDVSALTDKLLDANGSSGGLMAVASALALGTSQPTFLTALTAIVEDGAGWERELRGLGASEQASSASAGSGSTFLAGSGRDLIIGDNGTDRIQAGTGSAVVLTGTGQNVFTFVDGSAGGIDVIAGFKRGVDTILLQGYGPDAVSAALHSETAGAGATFLTLPDNTHVALLGVHGGLTAASFS